MNTKQIEKLLIAIVEKNSESENSQMLIALNELDEIVKQNDSLDRRLHHFLQRRSYQKALDWIKEL